MGTRGMNLDILARGPLWDLDLDYKCGTGHGIGHVLNVHESPNGFRWRVVPERNDSCVLEEGMIQSDEPRAISQTAGGSLFNSTAETSGKRSGDRGRLSEDERAGEVSSARHPGRFSLKTVAFPSAYGIIPSSTVRKSKKWLKPFN